MVDDPSSLIQLPGEQLALFPMNVACRLNRVKAHRRQCSARTTKSLCSNIAVGSSFFAKLQSELRSLPRLSSPFGNDDYLDPKSGLLAFMSVSPSARACKMNEMSRIFGSTLTASPSRRATDAFRSHD